MERPSITICLFIIAFAVTGNLILNYSPFAARPVKAAATGMIVVSLPFSQVAIVVVAAPRSRLVLYVVRKRLVAGDLSCVAADETQIGCRKFVRATTASELK